MAIPARAIGRQVNLVQALSLLLAFLLVAGIGGVLSAGLVMPAVASVSVLANGSTTVFSDLPAVLDEQPLSQKSTIYANDGTTVLATIYSENRRNVPLDKVAPIMQRAMVAIEDKRFFEHGAIDPQGMARAATKTALHVGKEGASTLTQQYVKNVLVEAAAKIDDDKARAAAMNAATTAEGNAGLSRKLHEAKLAIALEKKYTKDEILGRYLNIAPFGRSVYGVEAAAQYYFSKKAADLNYLEAATLAGVPKDPQHLDPIADPPAATVRRNAVLLAMKDQKVITSAEYTAGTATPLTDTAHGGYINIQQTSSTCSAANAVGGSGYFCDYVTKVILKNEAFGKDPDARKKQLYRGGLTITTTLDPGKQQIADTQVKAGVPVDDSSGVASAISVVEPGSGKILAMAQNRTYNPYKNSGARETSVNFNTDRAYGGSTGFQPGSTFKPFTLVEWFKEGHSANEVIDASRMQYKQSEFRAPCTHLVGTWPIHNAEGPVGSITVIDATKNSVNSGYVKMASELDLCAIFTGAQSLGVHLADNQAKGGVGIPVRPSNILGSVEVAPLTMAAAYAAFAADGLFCEPIAITKVVRADGTDLPVPAANCRQALEQRIAAAVNSTLSHVFEGTGKNIGALDRPSAGKTGTTSENEATWFVGYTPHLATAVWVGRSEGFAPIQNALINGKRYRYLYGDSIAGPTWKRFMMAASAGLPADGFPAAGTSEMNGAGSNVPSAPKPAAPTKVAPVPVAPVPPAPAAPAPAAPAKVAPVAPVPPAPVTVPRPRRTPGGGWTKGTGG